MIAKKIERYDINKQIAENASEIEKANVEINKLFELIHTFESISLDTSEMTSATEYWSTTVESLVASLNEAKELEKQLAQTSSELDAVVTAKAFANGATNLNSQLSQLQAKVADISAALQRCNSQNWLWRKYIAFVGLQTRRSLGMRGQSSGGKKKSHMYSSNTYVHEMWTQRYIFDLKLSEPIRENIAGFYSLFGQRSYLVGKC